MSATHLQANLLLIAEPNRFKIVVLLKEGPRSVGDIVQQLGIGQPHVSRHLRILSEANMVRVHKKGQQRIYTLQPQPFHDLMAWLDSFAILWESRLDAMRVYATTIQRKEDNENIA